MKKLVVLIAALAFALTACNPDNNGGASLSTCEKHNVELIAKTLAGNYFHDSYAENSYNYNIFLSARADAEVVDCASGMFDTGEDMPFYSFDIYAPIPSLDLNREFKVPIGTYTFDAEDSCEHGTLGASYTYKLLLDGESLEVERTFFTAGSVEVTKDGIEAILIDDKGKTHHVRYAGDLTIDNSDNFGIFKDEEPQSTLTSDLQLSFAENQSSATLNGDYYMVGKSRWDIIFYEPATDSQFTLEVLAPLETERLVGEFPVSKDWSDEQMILPGYTWEFQFSFWSWYDLYDGNYWVGGGPLAGGKMVISDNADGTQHVVMDVVDDKGHTIKAEFDTQMYADSGATPWSTRSVTMVKKPRVHNTLNRTKQLQLIKR